jgi:hypothetical protein
LRHSDHAVSRSTSVVAHNVSWRCAALCPELGVDRK